MELYTTFVSQIFITNRLPIIVFNFPLACKFIMLNPSPAYMYQNNLTALTMVLIWCSFATSAVISLQFCEIVNRNIILLACMISTHNTTPQYFTIVVGGIGQCSTSTCSTFLLGVLPFNNPRCVQKYTWLPECIFGRWIILWSGYPQKSWEILGETILMVFWIILASSAAL